MNEHAHRVARLEARIADLEARAGSAPARNPRGGLRRRLLLVGAALALALPTGVVLASHRFADVSDSNPFHADISRITDAGITNGCTPSTYCPNDEVTRGQMAAFLSRGLGQAVSASDAITFAEMLDGTPMAELTIDTGGVAGGTGYVLVTGTAQIQATDGVCPCDVGVVVRRGSSDFSPVSLAVARTKIGSGWWMGESTVTWVFEVPTASTETFSLRANGISWAGGETGSFAKGMLTALYVPFGSVGVKAFSAESFDEP